MLKIIIFSFLAMISWGVGDFLIQRTSRKVGEMETLFWIGLIGSFGLLPFVWKDLGLIRGANLFLLLGLGLVLFVASFIDIKALKKGKIAVVDVVLATELPITVALSVFFLGEFLSIIQIALMCIILIGIFLISVKSVSRFRKHMEKGVFLALLAALLMGGSNFLTGLSSKIITPLIAVWAPLVVITFASLFFIKKDSLVISFRKYKNLVFSMAVIDTFAWVFYALAMEKGEISIVTAITESYPAIAIFLGVRLNKEEIKNHQWMGICLALIASVLLATTM